MSPSSTRRHGARAWTSRRPGGRASLIPWRLKADSLAADGVSAEVVDVRTIRPLDEATIYESVRKTNRCVVVDEAWPFASVGSHLGWLVQRNCFDYLDAPVELVASEDVPMPYNHHLELAAQPSVDKILAAARRSLYLD